MQRTIQNPPLPPNSSISESVARWFHRLLQRQHGSCLEANAEQSCRWTWHADEVTFKVVIKFNVGWNLALGVADAATRTKDPSWAFFDFEIKRRYLHKLKILHSSKCWRALGTGMEKVSNNSRPSNAFLLLNSINQGKWKGDWMGDQIISSRPWNPGQKNLRGKWRHNRFMDHTIHCEYNRQRPLETWLKQHHRVVRYSEIQHPKNNTAIAMAWNVFLRKVEHREEGSTKPFLKQQCSPQRTTESETNSKSWRNQLL